MKTHARFVLLFSALLIFPFVKALADDALVNPDTCMVVAKEEKGTKCNNPASLALTIRNQCDQALDLKFAIETVERKWSSGVVFNVKPHAVNESAWTCASTGRYRVFARSTGSSTAFPEDKGTYRSDGNASYALAQGETPESACARVKQWGGGRCECEQPQLGTQVYRCRSTVSDAAASASEQVKPFPSNQFTPPQTSPPPVGLIRQEVKLTGSNMEALCGMARSIFSPPESSCVCTPASAQVVCAMTGLVPASSDANLSEWVNRKTKAYLKEKYGCDQAVQSECERSKVHSVAIGRRG